ncbi:hypothetical protein V6N11_041773 [Hibiscus sabdariffa]|uniref:Uncharacterized protein n=1 Tax=Hibiscus sabdariffa TaxID=183260 RepID=A0ABR2RM64_9ROSI
MAGFVLRRSWPQTADGSILRDAMVQKGMCSSVLKELLHLRMRVFIEIILTRLLVRPDAARLLPFSQRW